MDTQSVSPAVGGLGLGRLFESGYYNIDLSIYRCIHLSFYYVFVFIDS